MLLTQALLKKWGNILNYKLVIIVFRGKDTIQLEIYLLYKRSLFPERVLGKEQVEQEEFKQGTVGMFIIKNSWKEIV